MEVVITYKITTIFTIINELIIYFLKLCPFLENIVDPYQLASVADPHFFHSHNESILNLVAQWVASLTADPALVIKSRPCPILLWSLVMK